MQKSINVIKRLIGRDKKYVISIEDQNLYMVPRYVQYNPEKSGFDISKFDLTVDVHEASVFDKEDAMIFINENAISLLF